MDFMLFDMKIHDEQKFPDCAVQVAQHMIRLLNKNSNLYC